MKNIHCQLKPISRGIKSLTIFAEQVFAINDYILANIEVLHKTSRNNFQNVVYNITTEYCSSFANLPPFIKIAMSLVEKSSSNLIHECPYLPVKEIGIKNFIINSNLLPLVALLGIQKGDILMTATYTDEKGDLIFKVKIFCLLEKERIRKKSTNN